MERERRKTYERERQEHERRLREAFQQSYQEKRQRRRAAAQAVKQMGLTTCRALADAMSNFDTSLRNAVGEENHLVYRFLQLLLYVGIPLFLPPQQNSWVNSGSGSLPSV